ncbi:MAG: hypothetical protein M0Z83_07200 [Betaproteobacteria bacterium]|nr:hypothetical protein [Betaproteobacteria bacterium]
MLIKSFNERQVRVGHKRRTLLHYLRDESWSSLANLTGVAALSAPAMFKTLCQMERDGFLLRHKVPELRMNLWGITPKGLLFAWDENEPMENRPYFEPGKLSIVTIHHYLDIQRARLAAEHVGWSKWVPGNRLPKDIKKRPDAVATNPSGQRVAIEIERSIKTVKRYEAILSTYLQMIKQGDYAMVHYVCPDTAFAPRLSRLFQLIQAVPVVGERVPLTDKHRAKFPVYALENWPPVVGGMGISVG